MKTLAERKFVATIQTAFEERERILVVCRGDQEAAMAQARTLAIDLQPYGAAKLGQFWGTCPRSQKINVAVWLLLAESRVIFYGDVS